MSFSSVANQIIQDSIMSSIYIDDKIVEPFEAVIEGNEKLFEVSKGLYSSFREKNKSLDFYKFKLTRNWREDTDYIFKNRDLLILDWQLDETKDLKQTDALEILAKAVETDSLHFISIYTSTDEEKFEDIFYQIKAYFDIKYNSKSKAIITKLIDDLESEGIDTTFFKEHSGKFKEIALKVANKEIIEEIKGPLIGKLGKHYKSFSNTLKEIDKDLTKAWEIFGYCLNEEEHNTKLINNVNSNVSFIERNFIVINHTIIQITNKENPKPEVHFDFFRQALLDVCGNLLSLTSLEIKNLLRDSSGFIGKDADSIDEAALFHHQSKKENFFEFIIEIWKSHTFSHVDYNLDKLSTLNTEFWKEYKGTKDIDGRIESLRRDENRFCNELAKLNVYYNSLHIGKPAEDKIKFGDIFLGFDGTGKPDGKYWLNISAHCDCLVPEDNLKNNFYFVSGVKSGLKESLSLGDRGFTSYIKNEGEFFSIMWNQRPVILNIQNSNMVNYRIKAKDGKLEDFEIRYIGTLKENYAQRMANNSFSFAMRVGIDFASI